MVPVVTPGELPRSWEERRQVRGGLGQVDRGTAGLQDRSTSGQEDRWTGGQKDRSRGREGAGIH